MEDTVGRVIHGDCRSIIPTLQFDYVITDPPYNIDYRYTDYADRMSDEDYVALLATLKPYRSVLIHYTEAFIGPIRDAIGIPTRTVAWCYNTPLNRQHRTIAWFGCTPDLTLVRQPYKNPNDKRVRAHVQASGSEGGKLYDWWEMPVVKNKFARKDRRLYRPNPRRTARAHPPDHHPARRYRARPFLRHRFALLCLPQYRSAVHRHRAERAAPRLLPSPAAKGILK